MEELDFRELLVEALGPFTLCFIGIGTIIATAGSGFDLVAVALAHGLAIGLMVLAAGHISGGHFNPAITAGFMISRRISPIKGIAYIVAQLVGAVLGAGAVTLVFNDLDRNADGVNLGLPSIGISAAEGVPLTSTNAVIMEAILTFFLVFVVFGTAVDKRSGGKWIAGLAIGLTITMGVFAGGGVSGAALNPARWFGPAVIQNDWTDGWIWIVGPVVGGVIAALFYNEVLLSRRNAVPDELPGADEIDAPVSETVSARPKRRSRRK